MIFNVSGGGTALNFRVVGGTTAPANPAENCIWVNTDNPITSWLFSATEPSPAEAGMVWITIGSSSSVSFNALKKNGIQVYPISAKQYIGGAWVDKTAKSWQGGKWVDWLVDLLTTLDEFQISKASKADFSMDNGILNISYSSSNGDASDVVMTRNEILNTRGRSKITVIAQFNTLTYVNSGFYPMFGLVKSKPSGSTKPSFDAVIGVTKTTSDKENYELKLDNYQGDYYFVIYSAASKGNIYDITLI